MTEFFGRFPDAPARDCRDTFRREWLNMQCLLIEDDVDTARYISNGLKEGGVWGGWWRNGVGGLHPATSERWGVVILHRVVPGGVEGLLIVPAVPAPGKGA